MKNKIILLFCLFYLNIAHAQLKTLTCENTACSADFLLTQIIEKPFYSAVDIGIQNEGNIFLKNSGPTPQRNTRLYVEQNNLQGKDLTVEMSAKYSESNAADVMVIGDVFSNINVNLNGYVGQQGKDASQICADEFKKGAAGIFGQQAYEQYDARRLFDNTLSRDRCSIVDVNWLQTFSFTCGQIDFQEIDSNSPSVLVKRLKGKNRCLGVSYADVCLSKTVEVTCTWRIKYTDPSTVAGQFSSSPNYPDVHTKVFRMSELEYFDRTSGNPNANEYLCNTLSYNPILGSPPIEKIKNGFFYFDLRDWTNDGVVWSNERLKLAGGPTQTVKPIASQVISTIPGRDYRFTAKFIKALEHPYVSVGRVTVWDSASRNNKLKERNIYEKNAVKGVFLSSDDAPHHFGEVLVNGSSGTKTINIINRDDRPAINCSPPFIDGDITHFSIVADSCGTSDLAEGATCSVGIQARPKSFGEKTAYLKRICADDFGNTLTQLNEPLYATGRQDVVMTLSGGIPSPAHIDGFYWVKKNVYGTFEWFRCDITFSNDGNSSNDTLCFTGNPDPITNANAFLNDWRSTVKGKYVPGYTPQGMTAPNPLPSPIAETEFPIVQRSSVPADPTSGFNYSTNTAIVDFVFTATTNQTVLDLSAPLKYHTGYFDDISFLEISQTAGPDVKPPADKLCPDPANTPGCLSGALGNGYYELFGTSSAVTSPGYDTTYYTIPSGSDWKIRYVDVGLQCPQFYTKIKNNHLASSIGYDDNDNLCNDVLVPEDPSGRVIQWQYVGFDRQPEFGTETIQCDFGNCLVDSNIRDSNTSIMEINPGTGTDGSQQGSGIFFLYDTYNFTGTAVNGSGGQIGSNDLPTLNSTRFCAKVLDADTQGLESTYAAEPKVEFRRYNWQALKVINNGNFGRNPPDNGKKIRLFKKIDSSVRYLLKKELL